MITLLPLFEQNRMDVAFEMVDRNQRLIEREGQSLGIADSHQQGTGEAGTLGDGDRIDRSVRLFGLGQCLLNNGNNRPQVLARGKLRHNSPIRLMRRDLRSDNI